MRRTGPTGRIYNSAKMVLNDNAKAVAADLTNLTLKKKP
ncbi:hypothetical protein APHCR_0754 [Anaplasma phagocytophilum str. CR1007]|nr:hypothetical protein APHCR_0754 [Anaplasma phagocytophilum str. CR1007]